MTKPKQRIPYSKKNKDWREENVKFFYLNCAGRNLTKVEATRLYNIAAGHLVESDYHYVTQAFNPDHRAELSGSPARIKNMDIITPILLLLLGEKTKRPNQPITFAKNSDFPSQKIQAQYKLWEDNMHQMFINELINTGVFIPGQTDPQTGQPIQEPQSPEEVAMQLSNMSDWMAVQAQEALDYIRHFNKLDRNFREGFYDWLVTNSVYSYKDVRFDDTYYEVIPPNEIEYLKGGNNVRFLEKSQAIKRTQYIAINQIIDQYRELDDMTDKILDELEKYGTGFKEDSTNKYFAMSEEDHTRNVFYNRMFGEQTFETTNGDTIEVCHIVWKSSQEVIEVEGIDMFGNKYKESYDEDYVPLEGEKVTRCWKSQNWEGYMFGGKYALGIQPIPITRTSMNNESDNCLPYNGVVFHSREAKAKSTVQKLEEYQRMFNITYYHLQKVMNKNKDKLTILPLSMIPDKPGWDEFTMMYYADTLGFLFVDDSDPKNMQALQYVKVLDMALNDYIKYVYGQLNQIRTDAEECVGINRQRMGESMASDAVANNADATTRSVITTEELFVEYDEFEESEYQGLIDISKFAFVNGKKASYISSDGKTRYLDLNPESYTLIDAGVFVKNGGQEGAKLREFKQSAFAFAQNQMKPSLVAQIVEADNLGKLVGELKAAEQALEEQQQQQSQAENEATQAKVQLDAKVHDDTMAFNYYKTDSDNVTKKEIALIEPSSNDGISDLSKSNIEREWQEIEKEKNYLKAISEDKRTKAMTEIAKAKKSTP